jgi:hypothetical protein
MKKIVILLIAIITLMTVGSLCHCDDSAGTREIRTASGMVYSRDYVSSTIVVNYVRYHVGPDVKVYKGNSMIGFTGINVSDPVIIKYYQDSSGAYQVTEITVQYSGDFPV